MLKRAFAGVFVAADPGRLRLRTSARALLGIGLAVAAVVASGLPLSAAIAGGLAALLALFTVADPTVRGQAVTTALLPVAGLPVLALATALHGRPLARDAAFLAVVFCGVAARRRGPRGNAFGIFAFMMFFAAQFLHAVPGELPQLVAAVLLALAVAAGVRFGVWRIERRSLPPAAAPTPLPAGRGLAHPATRQAVQAVAACGFALAVGQVVSGERWYWAVGTAWWIFVNTASRGETLVRGFRRILGTVCGIAAGLLIAVPLHGAPAPTAALVAACVFGIFYAAPLSYSWMMFFVTLMAGLLYGLLGVLHPGLLALRLEQTVVGALGVALAVTAVLPVTTHAATDAWIRRALHCVRECAAESARRLAGDPAADPAPRVAELEAVLVRLRMSIAPLLHPLSPLRARKSRARQVVVALDDCARQVRGLAEVAADPDASHDARLTAACLRVEAAVGRLVNPAARPAAEPTAPGAEPHHHPGAERALAHLHGLEAALAGLAAPLYGGARAPLAGA
ncbi:FUSC family protein [Streptomyces sp. NBS 14/10]|uniref:FUSC family protein n=1 Tax=Streptomyces sp. NBS 14/10 TaxID=1945643 RepID=UPI00211ADE19|nr:FUSC family protein [Streptomyces sp. NBS 14/10]KAK1183726.1 FUSC family protein [Streptomyces sp. NBS 14/10]